MTIETSPHGRQTPTLSQLWSPSRSSEDFDLHSGHQLLDLDLKGDPYPCPPSTMVDIEVNEVTYPSLGP